MNAKIERVCKDIEKTKIKLSEQQYVSGRKWATFASKVACLVGVFACNSAKSPGVSIG